MIPEPPAGTVRTGSSFRSGPIRAGRYEVWAPTPTACGWSSMARTTN